MNLISTCGNPFLRMLTLLLAGLLAGVAARAQAPSWQTAVGSAQTGGNYATVQATATDASGNVYVAGWFGGAAYFGSTMLVATGSSYDAFVAKWSPTTGVFVWAVQAGGTGRDQVNGLAVSGGNVYLAGTYSDAAATFGSTTLANAGSGDVFLAKLTDVGPSASFNWALRAGGSSNDEANGLALLGTSLYMAGSFGGTAGFGGTSLTVAGGGNGVDVYVAKAVDAGSRADFVWAYGAGGTGGDLASAVAVLGSSVYISGWFGSSTAAFGSSSLGLAGSYDGFVAKLTDAGPTASFGWAKGLGGTARDQANALAVSSTGVYVAGYFESPTMTLGTTTLASAGSYDAFVAKLTDAGSTGSIVWAQRAGGSAAEEARSLAVDGDNVYVGGYFASDGVAFGNRVVVPSGASDLFVTKLIDAGATSRFAWVQQASGGSSSNYANALALHGTTLYVGGTVGPNAVFGGLSLPGPSGFVASLVDVPPTAPVLISVGPTSAAVGDFVALTGTSLAGATAVLFTGTGGNLVFVTAGFTVNAAGTQVLGVEVPSGAQSGPVSVVTPLGTSNGVPFGVSMPAPTAAPRWTLALPVDQPGANTSQVRATAPDDNGNVYVVGNFTGSVAFGNTTLVSAGSSDVFVAKWNLGARTYLWARRAGGTGIEDVGAVAVSGSSVYIAGRFFSPAAAFGPVTIGTLTGGSDSDVFVAKLTDAGSSGRFVWAQRAGGSSYDAANALAVEGTSVYVAGSFEGGAADFGGTTLASAGGSDVFVAKLVDAGPSASFAWAQRAGGSNYDDASALAVSGGTVYVGGGFRSGSAAFGGTVLANAVPAATSPDAFVAKLIDAGASASFRWALGAGGTGQDGVRALALRGTSLYATGYFESPTIGFGASTLANAGQGDAFVAKLADTGPSGAFVWAQGVGGPGYEQGSALALNGTSVYVAGAFSSATLAFGGTVLGGAGSPLPGGAADVFVAALTDAGSTAGFRWALSAGGPGGDAAAALAVSGGRLYVGGTANATAAFGSQTVANSMGRQIGFLAVVADGTLVTAAAPHAPDLTLTLGLYPNPAHATATVHLPALPGNFTAQLRLLDALGRVVRSQRVPLLAFGTTAEMPLLGLAPGCYYLQVQAGGQQAGRTLVVE